MPMDILLLSNPQFHMLEKKNQSWLIIQRDQVVTVLDICTPRNIICTIKVLSFKNVLKSDEDSIEGSEIIDNKLEMPLSWALLG